MTWLLNKFTIGLYVTKKEDSPSWLVVCPFSFLHMWPNASLATERREQVDPTVLITLPSSEMNTYSY